MKPSKLHEFSGSINLSAFNHFLSASNGVRYLGLKAGEYLKIDAKRKTVTFDFVANQNELNAERNQTHAIKPYLNPEEYSKLKDSGKQTPFVGNLTDWAQIDQFRKGEETEKTYFRGNFDFTKLIGVGMDVAGNFYIPIEANHLIKGEKGYYLSFKGFVIKKEDSANTHLLKLSAPVEAYNAMTDEQKKALPVIGYANAQAMKKELAEFSGMQTIEEAPEAATPQIEPMPVYDNATMDDLAF